MPALPVRPMLVAALLAILANPAASQERQALSGDRIAVYNLAGTVEVVAGTGSEVMVEVTRRGGDAARLRLETGEVRGRNTLRVIYPDASIRYGGGHRGSTEMRVRDDGTFNDGSDNRGRRVRISDRDGDVEAWADLRISVPAGRRMEVYIGVGQVTATGLAGDIVLDASSAGITASGIRGSLHIDTGSGDVSASDVDGPLMVDTGSGSVHVRNARNGEVTIDTGSGDVEVEDVATAKLHVDTGSGGVRVTGASAQSVLVDTGSGSVELSLAAPAGQVEVDTGSGSVRIRLPDAINATVDLDTSSGDVETEIPITITRRSRDGLRGTIGDGSGRITVSTGSGDISLLRR